MSWPFRNSWTSLKASSSLWAKQCMLTSSLLTSFRSRVARPPLMPVMLEAPSLPIPASFSVKDVFNKMSLLTSLMSVYVRSLCWTFTFCKNQFNRQLSKLIICITLTLGIGNHRWCVRFGHDRIIFHVQWSHWLFNIAKNQSYNA